MKKFVDPKLFGLPPSTKLNQVDTNRFDLSIHRKSRIIMKDGQAILTKVSKIKAHIPNAHVTLQTSAPVCSKTKIFLEENGIHVHAC
jgi:hypothetical protein